MMTSTVPHPTLDRVETVRLAITCEVWPDLPDARTSSVDDAQVVEAIRQAADTLADYFAPILSAVSGDERHGLVDLGDDVEPSEYDADVLAVCGNAFVDVTPAEWLTIADGYCLDLQWREHPDHAGQIIREDDWRLIPVLPADAAMPVDLLTVEGMIPAVAVPHTDEGWGVGGYEPTVVASFVVAVVMKAGR